MKIQIEATDQLTQMDGIPVRVWNGMTERGIPCLVMVHRVIVRTDADTERFERELLTMPEPREVTLADAQDTIPY